MLRSLQNFCCLGALLCILSFQANAQLTHPQFMDLDSAEQLHYVEHLQMILSDMTLSPGLFALLEISTDPAPDTRGVASNNGYHYTPLGNPKEIESAIATSQSEYDQFLKLLSEKKRSPSQFRENAKLEHSTRMVRLHLISAAVQARVLPTAEKTKTLNRIQGISQNFERKLVADGKYLDSDALYTADSNLKTLTSILHMPTHYDASSPASKRAPVAKFSQIPIPISTWAKVKPIEKSEALCLYAGFVIQKDRCSPEEKLPFALLGVDAEKFQCPSPHLICNPLLFGFESDCQSKDFEQCLKSAKPVCTERRKNATQICREHGRDPTHLQRAVELIKANQKIYGSYLANLKNLCDEKSLRENSYLKQDAHHKPRPNYQSLLQDVIATCEVTRSQLETVTAIYQADLSEKNRLAQEAAKTKATK